MGIQTRCEILREVIFQDSSVCTFFTRLSVHQAQKSKIHLVNTYSLFLSH